MHSGLTAPLCSAQLSYSLGGIMQLHKKLCSMTLFLFTYVCWCLEVMNVLTICLDLYLNHENTNGVDRSIFLRTVLGNNLTDFTFLIN